MRNGGKASTGATHPHGAQAYEARAYFICCMYHTPQRQQYSRGPSPQGLPSRLLGARICRTYLGTQLGRMLNVMSLQQRIVNINLCRRSYGAYGGKASTGALEFSCPNQGGCVHDYSTNILQIHSYILCNHVNVRARASMRDSDSISALRCTSQTSTTE